MNTYYMNGKKGHKTRSASNLQYAEYKILRTIKHRASATEDTACYAQNET